MIHQLDIEQFEPSSDKLIWDVRDAAAYRTAHIAHAINKPVDDITLADVQASTGTIYVLCGGGNKAVRAVNIINELAPECTIVHLTGGTRKAKALGWQLVGDSLD